MPPHAHASASGDHGAHCVHNGMCKTAASAHGQRVSVRACLLAQQRRAALGTSSGMLETDGFRKHQNNLSSFSFEKPASWPAKHTCTNQHLVCTSSLHPLTPPRTDAADQLAPDTLGDIAKLSASSLPNGQQVLDSAMHPPADILDPCRLCWCRLIAQQ